VARSPDTVIRLTRAWAPSHDRAVAAATPVAPDPPSTTHFLRSRRFAFRSTPCVGWVMLLDTIVGARAHLGCGPRAFADTVDLRYGTPGLVAADRSSRTGGPCSPDSTRRATAASRPRVEIARVGRGKGRGSVAVPCGSGKDRRRCADTTGGPKTHPIA
jgi:hypothetical protein